MKKGLSVLFLAVLFGLLPITAHAQRFDRGDRYGGGRTFYRGDSFSRPRSGFSFSFGFGSGFRNDSYTGFSYSRYYAPFYVRPAPVYVAAPSVVYYEPAPVFCEQPVYYQPARVYYYSEPYYPRYRPSSSFYFSSGYYYSR